MQQTPEIISALHAFVPGTTVSEITDNLSEKKAEKEKEHDAKDAKDAKVQQERTQFGTFVIDGEIKEQVLFGGDSVTWKMTTSVIHSRAEAVKLADTGGGLLPFFLDFHGQFQIGDQCWAQLVVDNKAADFIKDNDPVNQPGTLQNLAANVKKKIKPWKDGFKTNDRFFEMVTIAHALGLLLKHFGMAALDRNPTTNVPAKVEWVKWSVAQKRIWFNTQMRAIIDETWEWSLDPPPVEPPPQRPRPFICARKCGRCYARKAHVDNHDKKCKYNGPPLNPEQAPPVITDWWYCPKGCGFRHPLRYGKAMRDHELLCEYSGPAAEEEIKSSKKSDFVFNYHRRLFNLGMLYLYFRECIRYGNGPLVCDTYKWVFVLSRQASSWGKYAPAALFLWLEAKVIECSSRCYFSRRSV